MSDIQARLGHTSLAVTGRYLARLHASENRHLGDLSRFYGLSADADDDMDEDVDDDADDDAHDDHAHHTVTRSTTT